MKRQILFIVIAGAGISVLGGCNSGSDGTTTAQEKKAILGGPMPPEARKEFEKGQREAAARIAATAANAAAGQSGTNK